MTTVSTTTNAPLMWAPPSMHNPTIINLNNTGSQTWWNFAPTQDVIFIGSSHINTNTKLQTQGGHNIMVLGGDYHPTGNAGAALSFYGVTGQVWIDGANIDASNAGQRDGIDIAGTSTAQPDLVIQNTRITNIHGAQNGVHADVVQTQGPAGNLKFYNVTGTTDYQGLFIAPQYQPQTSSADLHNVNLAYTRATTDSGNPISYLLWTLDSPSEHAYPITFDHVNVVPRAGQSAVNYTIWPTASMGAVQSGNQVSFHGLPYTGSITVGAPAHDYADSGKIGLNFTDTQAILNAATGHGTVSLVGGAATTAGSATSSAPAGSATSPASAPVATTAPASLPSSTATAPANSAPPAPTADITSVVSDHPLLDLTPFTHGAILDISGLMASVAGAGHEATLHLSQVGGTLHVNLESPAYHYIGINFGLQQLTSLADLVHLGQHHG